MNAHLKGRRLSAIVTYWQMGKYDALQRQTGKWLGPYGSTTGRVDAHFLSNVKGNA